MKIDPFYRLPTQFAYSMNFDLPTLDQMTGGIFGAITSSERTSRVRAWLATEPNSELMQAVYKELSSRDKGACRPLREKLDDLKRAKQQDGLAEEWAEKAQALLIQPKMNIADGMAWQRDAAKAGAPLSKEPLVTLKLQLAERISKIEDLQHQIAVQKEGSALFAQRLDTLSTKPLAEVLAQKEVLIRDAQEWLNKTHTLSARPEWQDLDPKLPPQLQAAEAQLNAIWGAFAAVLDVAQAALNDGDASLPSIPVWADEIRALRGAAVAEVKPSSPAAKPKIDPEQRKAAHNLVIPILKILEDELAAGHGKASAGAASNLRQALKEHGAWIDGKLDLACHSALSAAGELEGWQRWRADQLRQNLLVQAQALVATPLGGRKQQEAIRQLREQWKSADQGGIPNHGLWKRFDDACNTAYKTVEVWLEEIKAKSAVVIAERQALIDELKQWGEAQLGPDKPDWKNTYRSLHQFGNRWREAGHLGERDYDTMQKAWKAASKQAAEPLETAQKASLARRQGLIEQAKAMAQAVGQGADLRIDAVRQLQQEWQVEAQSVPLDRKLEQKQWDSFKATIDSAFTMKDEARKQAQAAYRASLSVHDLAVLEASKALDEANASGVVAQIQQAMNNLQSALRGQVAAQEKAAEIVTNTVPEPVAEPVKAAKPLIAMRSDDRKSAKAPETSKFGKKPSFEGSAGRGAPERETRGPRLSDEAFHAQRKAMEQAEFALRKLQIQAHGEIVTRILTAWQERSADKLPPTQDLGKAVNSATRQLWTQSLAGQTMAADAAHSALLRLEMASGAPTPADFLADRRMLQLQLLTQRNRPGPSETWGADIATVLGAEYSDGSAKRLQANLKALLKA